MTLNEAVAKGLSATQKYIPSRYFYDAEGDLIFQAIMRMPEYYLTKSEYEIFSSQTESILSELKLDGRAFDLIEFGAGDGSKTKILIERLMLIGAEFTYMPIDISGDVLKSLESDLKTNFPGLKIKTRNEEYFQALENIGRESKNPKLVLFLGSSIGNFPEDKTNQFLIGLNDKLNSGDHAIIGFDLKKNPIIILEAYNDKQGITRAFNMNLLKRINKELEADFDLSAFEHYPLYDPETGFAKSYLVSLRQQKVNIKKLNTCFSFESGETIHTEISRKYSVNQIEELIKKNNFKIIKHFFDCRHYYVDTLIQKP